MQKGKHPKTHPVVFVDGDHQIISESVLTSDKTVSIDGVDHFVIPIEISSFTHPLYTGESKFVDTQGQVEKFDKKKAEAKARKAALKEIAQRKAKRIKQQESAKSLKDLLGSI